MAMKKVHIATKWKDHDFEKAPFTRGVLVFLKFEFWLKGFRGKRAKEPVLFLMSRRSMRVRKTKKAGVFPESRGWYMRNVWAEITYHIGKSKKVPTKEQAAIFLAGIGTIRKNR